MATPTPTPRSRAPSKHKHANSSSQVRVVVRVRPFLPSEVESKDNALPPCISIVEDDAGRHSGHEITVHIKDQWSSRRECYKLDSFFRQDDDLARIFHSEVIPLVRGVLDGVNATVFAYGATGSGKTYTMQGTNEQVGLIPLALSNILSLCANSGCSVEVAYYEVYMDRCYDLLEPKAKEIMVLEDKGGQVQLKGLSRVPVRSMPEFSEAFASGVQRRKTAHTGLNDVSSRSHGVLSIIVSNGSATGKLNLIDLAGNEDNRRTGNEGIRLLESTKINQSLFTLSNVIYALNNNEPRVPYRESKLTRILQDSLGGSSRALMIACLNPVSYQEAVHTVSLAARSRHITTFLGVDAHQETPKVKIDMEAKLLSWLEFKGKTKSIQRMNGPFSPTSARTPASVSVKRPDSARSSVKAMIQGRGSAKGRKLFDCGVPIVPAREEACSFGVSSDDQQSAAVPGHSCLPMHQSSEGVCRSLDGIHHLEPFKVADVKKESIDSSSNKENTCLQRDKIEASPAAGENIWEPQISVRKALSPVQFNMPPLKNPMLDNLLPIILLEPKTPKTPFEEGKGAPLEKFNALSSRLKDSLVQEYLEFLNTATREELIALKGIGQKRAEYILQLREESPQPLKTLNDLEKIGLSSKQVHNMFRGTARGIFA